jgi:pimeloyl-ACP methyl ester carboxylesterase
MNRGYLEVGSRRIHVLTGGRGEPLLLLQDPPLSALDLRSLADALATTHAVILPDLAGCGLTDRLLSARSDADALAADIVQVMDRLEVRAFIVYARGTAAAVARGLRVRAGERVRRVLLDDPSIVDPEDAAAWRSWFDEAYPPEPSGAHLVRLWDRVRTGHQFRPAFRQTAAARLSADMPNARALTRELLGWLRAGAGARDVMLGLAHPLDHLEGVGGELDDRVRRLPGTEAARAEPVTVETLRAGLADLEPLPEVDLRAWRTPLPAGAGLSRTFVPVSGGELHAQVSLEGPGRPVVVLHDPAGTSELVLPFAAPLCGGRPVLALDLPGNGESDDTLGTPEPSSATYARVVGEALDSLGFDEVDLIGRYSGGPIGMELSFRQPGRVRHLVQAGITVYEPDEARRLLASYTPSIEPQDDGGHLLRAWHIMKSQALYWPWFDQSRSGVIRGEPQLEAALIHRRVVDLLKCGDRYRQAYAALWTYPLAERLGLIDVPTLLCAPAWDPLYPHLGKAIEAGPQCRSATLPDRFGEWHQIITPFLDDSAPLSAG